MTKLNFAIRAAKVIGKDHLRAGRNCQDGYAFKEITIGEKSFLIGVVSDGCSQGNRSEIGGLLIPIFIVGEITRLLQLGIQVDRIPMVLYPSVVKFLEGLRLLFPIREMAEMVDFVQNYLLATVVGFVLDEENGVVFYSGDGYLVIDNEIQKIDYQNQNPYIGYHLVPHSVLESIKPLPKTFEVKTFKTDLAQKIAIATDGFSENLLERLWQEAKPVPLGIQLWMNCINGPRNPNFQSGLFYDDACIVAAQRQKE
jgi:hypothetical protein